MGKQAKIMIAVVVLVILGVAAFFIYKSWTAPKAVVGGDRDAHGCIGSAGYSWCELKNKCLRPWEENCEPESSPAEQTIMTESEAKAIAEATCIKGGESLSAGTYNEITKTWWFDAKLNAAQEGCNPACVVSEETKTAEINWRCTGLVEPQADTQEIQKVFVEKYPNYAGTLTIRIDQEAGDFMRGGVSFEAGTPGGIFLAARIDGKWQIMHEGNGEIPCELSEKGFPLEMLADCAKK